MKDEGHFSAKEKILEAALSVIRTKGYCASTVDDLCEAAGVTKGAFFHHFKSKEDLGVSAAEYWTERNVLFFGQAPYQKLSDPLDQLLGYVDFRLKLLVGEPPEFTCLVGTMVQEIYHSNSKIREACKESIFSHAASLEGFIRGAKALYAPKATWSVESLALHTQCVIQGAFILAKADDNASRAIESVGHLRRYIEFLFNQPHKKEKKWSKLNARTRKEREHEGGKAWMAWAGKNSQWIVDMGAPLGKTKRVDAKGVSATKNKLTAYTIVQAKSHQAAAKLFLKHPHFSIFPGDSIEIIECLPIPTF
jgi:TetR/AcrR family transcriptional repressor of nem operon